MFLYILSYKCFKHYFYFCFVVYSKKFTVIAASFIQCYKHFILIDKDLCEAKTSYLSCIELFDWNVCIICPENSLQNIGVSRLFIIPVFLIKYTFRVFKYSLYHLEIFKSCCSSSHQGYLIFLSVQILFVWTVIFHYHHNTVKDVVGLVAWVSLQSYSLLRSLLLVYFPFG